VQKLFLQLTNIGDSEIEIFISLAMSLLFVFRNRLCSITWFIISWKFWCSFGAVWLCFGLSF